LSREPKGVCSSGRYHPLFVFDQFRDTDGKLLPIEQKVGEAVFQYDEMINAEINDR